MKAAFKILVIGWLYSCGMNNSSENHQQIDTGFIIVEDKFDSVVPPIIIESFTDSTTFGKKRKNKIEVKLMRNQFRFYANIKLYSKKNKQWLLKNEVDIRKNRIPFFEPIIEDFNNDGFNDLTVLSENETDNLYKRRTLLIYSPKEDNLVWIKNSADYQNLVYNGVLNCLDSKSKEGCKPQYFLKIEKDKLIEFASIDLEYGIVVSEINNGVKNTIISDYSKKIDCYVRYENFNPLTRYKYIKY